jgi:hypothetical protein
MARIPGPSLCQMCGFLRNVCFLEVLPHFWSNPRLLPDILPAAAAAVGDNLSGSFLRARRHLPLPHCTALRPVITYSAVQCSAVQRSAVQCPGKRTLYLPANPAKQASWGCVSPILTVLCVCLSACLSVLAFLNGVK